MTFPNILNYPCPHCNAQQGEHCKDASGRAITPAHISREPQSQTKVDPDRATLQWLTDMIVSGN